MDVFQKAVNYETLIEATQKADSYCMELFDDIGAECDISEALPANIRTYCDVTGINEYILSESYYKVRLAFEGLDPYVTILDQNDERFPKDVSGVPFLYLKGNVELLMSDSISVVGTRHPSNRAIELTKQCVDAIGQARFSITSGLALGIDGVAHIRALSQNFPTIAVLGTSLNKCYPAEHQKLQSLVAEHGLLVSQFAPSRETQKYFFLMRNSLMSQISRASLVIEDRDGGGGVQQAKYSEKAGKKVLVLKETYENRTYLWPRSFKEAVIVKGPQALWLELGKLRHPEKTDDLSSVSMASTWGPRSVRPRERKKSKDYNPDQLELF